MGRGQEGGLSQVAGIRDLNRTRGEIVVRRGKGAKGSRVGRLHERDPARSFGDVSLPEALGRKYPRAARHWGWQFVFPTAR